jgi:hypothetical protein
MKTVNIYTIDEMNEESRKKAIENIRNSPHCYFDPDLEIYKDELSNKGFENAEIYYTGFYSQGDGACFVSNCNIRVINDTYKLGLKRSVLECLIEYFSFTTDKNTSRYYHEKTMDCNAWSESRADRLYDKARKVSEQILEIARGEARQIYRSLEAEYNYQHSDEYIVEYCQVNAIEFLESGKIYS